MTARLLTTSQILTYLANGVTYDAIRYVTWNTRNNGYPADQRAAMERTRVVGNWCIAG